MLYLDSSVAVSALSAEPATATVLEWLARGGDILISDWLLTEAAAALAQKRRMRIISAKDHAEALAALHRQIEEAFSVLPVTREDFRSAARLAERSDTGLRAGDALHLAIAAAADATLCTIDKRQAQAGAALGIATFLIYPPATSR